jgi:hypothetical protein
MAMKMPLLTALAMAFAAAASADMTVTATPENCSTIRVDWTDPQALPDTTYRVERSLDGQTWGSVADTAVTSYMDSGLAPATTYQYRVASSLPACKLDVDGNGRAEVSTDVTYITRRLLGLTPVPPSYRTTDPSIPSDGAITARIDALRAAYDVDGNGQVVVSTDVTYIARRLAGLAPVPPSYRAADPSIPSDAVIGAAIDALCPR